MADASRPRVAIDATSLLGTTTGVGQVTARLIEALAARDELDLRAYAITWRGRKDLGPQLPERVVAATKPFPARLTRLLWPRVPVPRVEHWTGPVDLVHATSFVAPPSRAPVLLTIHDLTFVHFPEMCSGDTLTYPRLIRAALHRGATVHTYSDAIAQEVIEHFDLAPERVVRIYPGLAPTAGGDPARGQQLAGTPRYVLALGTIEPRKNLPMLVRAFDVVAGDDPQLRLVIGGPDGWGAEAFAAACDAARHGDRVVRLGYVDERDRRDLLAGARVLAYPSVYEGFGHPPLEAMQAGVPVVASSARTLVEVLGSSALLPDPHDIDAIADALARAINDERLRADLVQRGFEQTQRYRWDRAAEELTRLYWRLCATPRR